jgi:hypothetical protein
MSSAAARDVWDLYGANNSAGCASKTKVYLLTSALTFIRDVNWVLEVFGVDHLACCRIPSLVLSGFGFLVAS